ncbi:unnamed protein product, partial [Ascophyllum nodosum]
MPSETLGFMLIMQLQFLATLSLVDYEDESFPLIHLAKGLRWANLWWSPSYDMGGFSECWERRNGPINAPMFFGNTTLAL